MGRSRYKIYHPKHPHFITCTILHWIPIFTNKDSVQIVIDSLKYLQKEDNLKIYAYVILENHIHFYRSQCPHWECLHQIKQPYNPKLNKTD